MKLAPVEAGLPSGVPNRNNPQDRATLLLAAKKLEAVLMQNTITAMEKAQLTEGFFGSGPQKQGLEATFEHFLGESLSKGRGMGLAEQIVDQWMRGRTPARTQMDTKTLESLALDPDTSRFFRGGAQVEPVRAEEEFVADQGPAVLGHSDLEDRR